MAGYLADMSYWNIFVPQWRHFLLKHGLGQIHMRNLIPLQGEYRELGWDARKRNEALVDFIRVIRETHLIGFGVGVDADYWRKVRKRYEKCEDVQTFCFARIMKMVVGRMKRAAERDVVVVHFDTARKFGSTRFNLFSEIWERDPDARQYLSSICFADPRIYLPLQAADFLAWETRKNLIQKIGGYQSTPRWKQLFEVLEGVTLDYQSELWDKPEIEAKVVPTLGPPRTSLEGEGS
jgi:hypothetical protein